MLPGVIFDEHDRTFISHSDMSQYSIHGHLATAWVFKSASELYSLPSWAHRFYYSGSGYAMDLPKDIVVSIRFISNSMSCIHSHVLSLYTQFIIFSKAMVALRTAVAMDL